MKTLFSALFSLAFFAAIAQQKRIVLQNGSTVFGEIVRVDSMDGQTYIRIGDGDEIRVPSSSIETVDKKAKAFFNFEGGHQLLRKGRYMTLAFQTLAGKTSVDFGEYKRWNFGGHTSVGYQFGQYLALGGGAGIDVIDAEVLMPIFLEAKGWLTIAPDYNLTKSRSNRYRFPFTYSLQFGLNLPVEEYFNNDEILKRKIGLLFYPALGLAFPTKSGTSLLFDAGYKIQRFARTYEDWWNGRATDTITLKSFAMRMGVMF